tara:strand:+ start:4812 stop:5528 length:717 start_codon:yes stop_codon:yes gene_type:complete
MAKRYFDTDIWKKKWFRSLSPKYKSVWWYIISQCDHAGFFEPDIEIMSIFIGEELDEKELMNIFDERIEYLRDDKWFIPKFIQFQYNVATPDELNLNNRVHKSVYDRIEKYGIEFRPIDDPTKGHVRVMQGASTEKEGAKDKDKDKELKNVSNKIKRKVFKVPTEQEVEEYCKERSNNVNAKKFIAFYESKGWMVGKNKMKSWQAAVRSWEQADKEKEQEAPKTRAFIQDSDRNRNDF